MKRTAEMARAGTPTRGQKSKAKGHVGVGKPKREWRPTVHPVSGLPIHPVLRRHPNRKAK